MKKRLIAMLLCLVMVWAAALPAMGAELTTDLSNEQRVGKLAELFRSFIAEKQFKSYDYDEEQERFSGKFSLDSALGECTVFAYIYYDMLSIRAWAAVKVPAGKRDNMAKFLTMANNEVYYSHFLMDYETGEVSSRGVQLIEEVFPTLAEIDVLHAMAVQNLDDWGNGIARVATGADPVATFEETLKEIEAKGN